jgi:hypothetical protein
MSYCPLDATSGFIQLTGPIPPHALKEISQNRYPIQTSFAPRTTPASLTSFHISDTNHTCLYRNKTYTLVDIQICQPLHTGYTLPSVTEQSSAEMILSFSGADPSGLLLSIPIFNTGAISNDQYLSQVLHQPNITNAATLDTMLQQTSFGYRTCFETVDSQQHMTSHSLYVLVFPHGIQLSQSNYTALTAAIGTPVPYGIPPGLCNGEKTVQSYTIDKHGNKTAPQSSDKGYIATDPIATCDEIFTNTFEYFTKGPTTIHTKSFGTPRSSSAPALYSTSQYKCAPFDQSRVVVDKDNNTIYVTPDVTDPTLQTKVAANQKAVASNGSTELSAKELAATIGGGCAGVICLAAIGGVIYYIMK